MLTVAIVKDQIMIRFKSYLMVSKVIRKKKNPAKKKI